jgi:pimeloyl-ACP methyl ester carboxylesterase
MKTNHRFARIFAYLMLLALSVSATAARAAPYAEGFVTTNDGVRLHYLEAGTGDPLVLVPGWSQTAEEWKYQLDGLSAHHHVYAVDMRGHGKSDKPDHGYRIARLAVDLHDFLVAKNLTDVTIDGHSMGCSVIWGYWELFGSERIKKLILTDQMPAILGNPAWSDAEKADAGPILMPDKLFPLLDSLAGPDGQKTTVGFLKTMFTPDIAESEFNWALAQNLEMPRKYAAALLYDHAAKDWRDVIPKINVPTLVIGAKGSLVPWTSVAWIAGQIKGSTLAIFEKNEAGYHFMFIQNPAKYNALIEDFLAK